MNGSGHLLEDFAAPSHLCPVDLAKLDAVLGCPILPRYRALLAFCQARVAAAANGPAASPWAEHAAWLQRAISVAEGASAIVSKSPEGAARGGTAGSGRGAKRKRD